MQQTAFHAYYTARALENLSDEDRLVSVYASSDIKIYPFQIAAAAFALRSPYRKGVILCDEAGMGKSHEAMLVITQKWLEGCDRILLVTPNADLLRQWAELIDLHYTVPYVVLTNRDEWQANISEDNPNAFVQNAVIVSTYDFVADNESSAKEVDWDLTVFEEANALSSVYHGDNKLARALKRIAGDSFKLLLTGTPIEKNIMDLYGLIWFIDETVLPKEQDFLSRYLRKPENYPELAERVSGYCFRTLRSQAKNYAKVTGRKLITYEYKQSEKERQLYDLLYDYINKPSKIAFPEMDKYDLALRLLSLQSSSTAAILQTVKGIIKRLETLPGALEELNEWRQIQRAAEGIPLDSKAKALLNALKIGFNIIKKSGANKKAIIFTESVETQKMLTALLSDKYKTFVYNGSADYNAIREFKAEGDILISTDNGAIVSPQNYNDLVLTDENFLFSKETGIHGFRADKMGAPPKDTVNIEAGRVNEEGNSYLYLASDKATACSEVQPICDDLISVAEFKLTQNIKLVDLRNMPTYLQKFTDKDNEDKLIDMIFCSFLISLFSTPVGRCDGKSDFDTQRTAE